MRGHLVIIIILSTLLTGSVAGQDCVYSLIGTVKDDEGKTLPGATITLSPSGINAISESDGSFRFNNLCQGFHELRAHYIGFGDVALRVKVPSSEQISVRLSPSSTTLEDVVIEGEQRSTGVSQTVSLLQKEDLASLHGKPLGDALREIPGVSAIQTGPAIFKPVIHGLHSQRILILNNGIRQEGQQWGIEHAPEVDPYIASTLEVVKGAETVRYGADAIGGVIIVNPPSLHDVRKLGGDLNLGFMSNNRMAVFSGMLEGNLKKDGDWTWRVQSSFKKGGDYHSPDYSLSNTGSNELNFSGALGFSNERQGLEIYVSSFNTEIGILRAAHTGSLEDLQSAIESGSPWYIKDFSYDINNPRQKIDHHLLKVKSYFQVKDLGKLNILYGGQYNLRKEFDIRRGGRSERPALSMHLLSHVIDVSLDHERKKHSGSIGINTTVKNNWNDTDQTGIVPLLPDYRQVSAGIFFLEKLRRNKWTFEAGGRYDHQYLQVLTFVDNDVLIKPEFNFDYFSGTLGLSYLINPTLRFISNVGYSTRPPHVSELYSEGLHHGTGSIEEGLMRTNGQLSTDQNLIRKEQSKKWINTLQYTGRKTSFDLSLYYNHIDNYVFIRPYETRLTTRGYFPVLRFEQTDAVLTGGDVALKWDLTRHLTYNGKISYTYARDVSRKDVLIFIPPAQIENGITYHFPQQRRLKDMTFTVNVPWTLKQTRAPEVIYPEDVNPETPLDEVFDFAPAPKGYFLLNARFGFKIPLREHDLSVILSGENLLNRRYRNYMNRLRYFADDTGANYMIRVAYNFFKH